MTEDNAIQFLLDFTQNTWGIHSRKIAINVFVHNFHKCKELSE